MIQVYPAKMEAELIWGVPPRDKMDFKLRNFPEGKVRLIFRHRSEGKACVKTKDGAKYFRLKMVDGFIEPWHDLGRNVRI